MKPLSLALILERPSFREQVLQELKEIPVRVVLDQGGFGAWHLVHERIERLQPDVILADLGEQPDERFSYIQLMRTMSRPPAVVVVHDSSDAGIILKAMRAGAAEFLTIPLEPGALVNALERISAIAPGAASSKVTGGRLLAFVSVKGGAGATTLACNVAAALGRSTKQEILLADLDLETGNVAFAMKAGSQYSILDACRNISRLDVHYWKGLISNGQPNLNILTAPSDLRGFDNPQGVEVRQVLSFARTIYAYSVIDMPSSLSRLTLAALEDADKIFLITTTDLPCLHLAKRALQKLNATGHPLDRVALVVNRSSRHDEVLPEDIERNLGVPVFWRFPNDAKSVTEFYVKGGVIAPNSDLGKSITKFVAKISGPPSPPEAGKRWSLLGL